MTLFLDTDFIIFFQVDTHVHAASGMNQKHLLRFIKRKMKYNADDIVMVHEGKEVTLREVNTATNFVVLDFEFFYCTCHHHRSDHHSKFSYEALGKKKPEKKSRLQWNSNL